MTFVIANANGIRTPSPWWGAPDVEVSEVVEPTVAENPVVLEARRRAPVRAFASSDAVNLVDLFHHRARVMRSVPHF